MAFRIFAVPIRDPAASQDELNSFLQSHKVLSVDQRWVDQGTDSFWSFCVDYHGSATKSASAVRSKKSQVDYREVLNEEDFAVYSELRELRKQVAQRENVAVYVVFTNQQLAEMVQQRAATKADLETIVGAGSARLGKYGEPFLELLSQQWSSQDEDFLGCRTYDNRTILNRRSRVRFRRKFVELERDFLDGRIDELELQQRATSLFAFARAAGVSSWHFRRRVLEQASVSGRMARTG